MPKTKSPMGSSNLCKIALVGRVISSAGRHMCAVSLGTPASLLTLEMRCSRRVESLKATEARLLETTSTAAGRKRSAEADKRGRGGALGGDVDCFES